ncbi:hypothetical protein ACJX0J_032771 [Zea mays]
MRSFLHAWNGLQQYCLHNETYCVDGLQLGENENATTLSMEGIHITFYTRFIHFPMYVLVYVMLEDIAVPFTIHAILYMNNFYINMLHAMHNNVVIIDEGYWSLLAIYGLTGNNIWPWIHVIGTHTQHAAMKKNVLLGSVPTYMIVSESMYHGIYNYRFTTR